MNGPGVRVSGALGNPTQLTRLGNRSLKCIDQHLVIVSFAAFAQGQVWSTRCLIVHGGEPAAWKTHDEIVGFHLNNEVR